jgi:hypothetical protein
VKYKCETIYFHQTQSLFWWKLVSDYYKLLTRNYLPKRLNPYSDGTTKVTISLNVSPDKSGFVRLSIPLHCVCTMQVSLKILISRKPQNELASEEANREKLVSDDCGELFYRDELDESQSLFWWKLVSDTTY